MIFYIILYITGGILNFMVILLGEFILNLGIKISVNINLNTPLESEDILESIEDTLNDSARNLKSWYVWMSWSLPILFIILIVPYREKVISVIREKMGEKSSDL